MEHVAGGVVFDEVDAVCSGSEGDLPPEFLGLPLTLYVLLVG